MTTDDQRTESLRPPGADARQRTWRTAFATLLIFTLLGGEFWRDFVGWVGFLILAVLLVVGCVIWLVLDRPRLRMRATPKTLVLFLGLAALSIAWSDYRVVSVLGLIAQLAATAAGVFLALCLSWKEVLTALGGALRWILGLSILFELIVAVFIRHPILPLVATVDYGSGKLPMAFYWSRSLLFHGGQIQGILGNSNLLAMCALMAVIVFGIQLADRTVRRGLGTAWLVLAGVVFLLSRSSTVIAATLVTVLVFLFAMWARQRGERSRVPVYATALAVVVVGTGGIILLWNVITHIFGKSEDLTGRLTIWNAVLGLIHERPIAGWGWVSYWAPWVEPFKGLAIRKGVTYLQAHDAWLDVWLQLGIIGLIVFIALVASTLLRTWFMAVDRPRHGIVDNERYSAITLFPLLFMAALLAQSAAESRILVEGGWALLVLFALKTKTERA